MKKIAFIGAGSMAEAMIAGITEKRLLNSEQIYVTNRQDEQKLKKLETKYGITGTYQIEELFHETDVVILAMKPKDAHLAMQTIKSFIGKDAIILSVLAGISMNELAKMLGREQGMVRAMPNTSAAVGKSATALAFNTFVPQSKRNNIQTLFETIGLVTVVKEEQLDAVTGLSGSGPAYIYYLVEAMQHSAEEIGLDQETAKSLIIQTIVGAAEMISTSKKTPQLLRKEVTSPGGTTEAGIKVLDDFKVKHAFISCIKEATAQSKRLGNRY